MMGNKTMNPPPCELILEMSVLSTHAKKKSSEGKKKTALHQCACGGGDS